VVAGLVGGGGVLIMLSSASPATPGRLALLRHFIPLSLVEVGEISAALGGLVLLIMARGLARGYRSAFRATLGLLALTGVAAILKGFDWEETVVLAILAAGVWSQAALFDRFEKRRNWLEGRDLRVAFAALALFVTFGTLSYRVNAERLTSLGVGFGYRFQSARFIRTAASMSLGVFAGALVCADAYAGWVQAAVGLATSIARCRCTRNAATTPTRS